MSKKNPKTKVLLLDAYCVSHVGNDVLLESSIQLVKKIFDDPEIIVHAKSENAFNESLGISCKRRIFPNAPIPKIGKIFWLIEEILFMFVQWLNLITLKLPPTFFAIGARRDALQDYVTCDVAISIGGEMINDSFRKTLPMYMFMFWLAKKCGCKTVVFPQSIGPLKRGWTRWITRTVLKQLDIVMPRDEPSLLELNGLGLYRQHALASPDVGLAQPRDEDETALKYLKLRGIELDRNTHWIGLTTSAWVEEDVSKRNYLDELVDGIEALSKKAKIAVLIVPANMPVKGNDSSDYDASDALYQRIKLFCECHIVPREAIPARSFKAIAAQMSVYLSTRMHAAIMASMANTPTITVNTQRKLQGYMSLIGQEDFALDIEGLTGQRICERIAFALERREEIKESLLRTRLEKEAELDHIAVKISEMLGVNTE